MKLILTFKLSDTMQTMEDVAWSVAQIQPSLSDPTAPLQVGEQGVAWDRTERDIATWQVVPEPDWAGCCRASRRIWELVNAMYQKSDPQQLALSPTSTCAEIIATELGIPYGE